MLNRLRALPVFRPINTLSAYDKAVTEKESSGTGSLRFFRALLKKIIMYYFAVETPLGISNHKLKIFAECIAGKDR